MNHKSKIAVLGGGGRTGKFLVAQLFQQGYSLNVLLREPSTFVNHESLIEIVNGDALDIDAIRMLLKDCTAVLSTIGQRADEPLVSLQATSNIIKVMHEINIRRYILVAGINIDTPFDKKGPRTLAATEYMKIHFPAIQDNRQETYKLLSSCEHVAWTLVRVPMIEFAEGKGNIKVSLDDCPGTRITAGDIAQFVIQQLHDDRFVRKAPFIANV
jgi:putative NADH-flavin reductase